ncbi:hypothetical protein EZS27_024467 [termite gut metagenome]|jgi:hypothetical protein|uniref:Uncharacterized protein n=1 Tax=termite gut metagenome TaxID=433724 RepID=A0A5J4QWV6_9ZZZZ
MPQKTKEKKIDFRTPCQIERDERDEKIYIHYIKIKKSAINVSFYAQCRVIGNEFGVTPYAVRNSIDRYKKKLNPDQKKS